MTTIEEMVAEQILQQQKEVKVNGKTYKFPQPTMATIIMVSAEISKLPNILNENLENINVLVETLRNAKDCKGICRIVAIMLVGAKRLQYGGFFTRWRSKIRLRRFEREIMADLTPSGVREIVVRLFNDMQCADFFAVTTFLVGINATKPTTKVD